jgi:hypothetical protein
MKIRSLLLLVVLFGCQHKKNSMYDQQAGGAVFNWNQYSSLLVGKWTQCYSRSKDGVGIIANVCTIWIFDSNGHLSMTSGEYEKWYVDGDTLYLSLLSPADQNSSKITAEKYLITKSEDKNSITIDLTHTESEYRYSLTREQPYLQLYLPAFGNTKINSKD